MTVALNIDPANELKTLISAKYAGITVYKNGNIPTTGLPAEFISINMNGGLQTKVTKRGSAQCALAVSLYTKLLSTGAVNETREGILLGSFQSLFDTVAKTTGYSFEIAKNPMIYSGKSLITGYSTKVINVNCFINY